MLYNNSILKFYGIIMESGIYKLSFKGSTKVYIGRSKNIAARLIQHLSCMRTNKASIKLQEAYNLYGPPNLDVLEFADPSELDELEKAYIDRLNTVEEGLNTRKSTSGGHSGLWGDQNGRSLYSNEQIADVLFLLIDDTHSYTYPIIASKTGVPKPTIVDIANGTGHKWLGKVFPEEYLKLCSFRNRKNTRKYLKAVSPEGVVYTVDHLTNFCTLYNLQTGNVSRLLRGKCKSYNGWTAIP